MTAQGTSSRGQAGTSRALEVLRGLRWYVREVSGETAYARHVARLQREHPDAEPPDERAWWRARSDGREGEPPQRCC